MDTIFLKVIEASPYLGVFLILWYYQRKDNKESFTQMQKDYKELVQEQRLENAKREENYQNTISKLTENFNILEGVSTDIKELKDDVEDIKDKIK